MWIADTSSTSTAMHLSMLSFFSSLFEASGISVSEEDMYHVESPTETLQILQDYQDRPEYFVYVQDLGTGTSCVTIHHGTGRQGIHPENGCSSFGV